MLQVKGHCPICETETMFTSHTDWLRDHLLCGNCKSIPLERALMEVINWLYPHYPKLVIHESSPAPRGVSLKLQNRCPDYIPSQYFANVTPGTINNGFRCENLENMTFADESIDLHITQDVLEHLFDPEKAFREIHRTLRKGGAHIFTVPLVNRENRTEIRAMMENGKIVHLKEPLYHGNPIDPNGVLVTRDWGFDIAELILQTTGMSTDVISIDNLDKGIKAEYIEVCVSRKA